MVSTLPMSLRPGRRPASWPYHLVLLALGLLAVGTAASAAQPAAPTAGTSWWLHLRSAAYFYQTDRIASEAQDHVRAYQTFSGSASGLAEGRVTLRASGRLADDLRFDGYPYENARCYVGHAEIRIAPRVRARVGRQFLQEGVAGLTLDGLWLALRPDRRWDLNVWGGARAPYGLDVKPGSLSDASVFGGRIGMVVSPGLRVAVSGYSRERDGAVAERPLGVDATYAAARNVRVVGRAAYDLELEDWSRLEALTRWAPAPDLPVFTLQLIDRRPSIDAVSYFARFAEMKRIRLARAVARYETSDRFGGELEFTGSFVDERSSRRLGAALLLPDLRVGYSLRLGDAGEESCFYGDVSRRVLPWLWVGGQASLVTYALFEDAPADQERELTTLACRLRAELRPGLQLLAEVQSVENPFYAEDVRFLLGLNLSMARGITRFGLDRGGWL
ncbi:hypothetical protein H8E07_17010 [bacterium]|nr:hypothetical protein [bacterium]